MRAWQVQRHGEPRDALALVDVDVPEPLPGELRLRVLATGIGMPDVFMCRGTYPLTPTLPFTPGQEVCGVDVDTGTRYMGVTSFTRGIGGFGEQTVAPTNSLFAVPDGLDDAEAAGFWIPHLTAWVGLVVRGAMRPGEWLVVLGASGSSGIAAVRLGRALGARVIAVVGGAEKAAFCRSLGAEIAIDHRDVALTDAIRDATGGHGADLVYDPVGGEPGEAAARALARYGRFLLEGFASGAWPVVDPHLLVRANASLVGVFAGGFSQVEVDEIHARLSALVADGALGGQVTHHASFDDLPSALERLADRSAIGKSVLLAP